MPLSFMPRRPGGSPCDSLRGDGDGTTDGEGPSASGRSKKYAHNSCFEGKVIAVVSAEPSVCVYNSSVGSMRASPAAALT